MPYRTDGGIYYYYTLYMLCNYGRVRLNFTRVVRSKKKKNNKPIYVTGSGV